MKDDKIKYGLGGLIIGALLVWFATMTIVNSGNANMMGMMGMHALNNTRTVEKVENDDSMHVMPDGSMMKNMDDGMTMNDMVNDLKGKKGNDFDKAFLIGMIEHHQGAIDMANLAKQYAGHDEIKTMADSIISAQTIEIDQMRQWLKDWGN